MSLFSLARTTSEPVPASLSDKSFGGNARRPPVPDRTGAGERLWPGGNSFVLFFSSLASMLFGLSIYD
jgi:hypothetical protein